MDVQPRLPRPHLQAAPRHQVARRLPVHRRRRGLHLRDHDQPEDPRALQGGLPAREERGRAGSLHGAGALRQALRARGRDLGDVDPAQAPAPVVRRRGHPAGVAPEQPAGRDRALSLPGVEAGREGRAGRQSRLLRGPPVPEPHRVPGDPEPGHHLPRAEGQRRRLREHAHRHPVRAPDRVPRVPQGVPQVPLPGERLHVPRLQSQGSALRRPTGAPGLRPRDQQAGADRRGAARARPRGHRADPPRDVGLHRQGPALRLRSREGQGPARGGGVEGPGRRRRRRGLHRQAVHPDDPDQSGQRRAEEDRRDRPAAPEGDRHPGRHPAHRVGRVHQGVRQAAALRGGGARASAPASTPTSSWSGTPRSGGPIR